MIGKYLHNWLRETWLNWVHRDVYVADNHSRFDLLYRVKDPWDFDKPEERARFEGTRKIFEREFGKVESILEIGSGEGHLSSHFAQCCDRLTGIEVSRRANERARVRAPSALFIDGDLFNQSWVGESQRYSVVVACEVLYYMRDLQGTLETMTRLAKNGCLVSYYSTGEQHMGPPLRKIPGVKFESVRYDECEWIVAWWPTAPDSSHAET